MTIKTIEHRGYKVGQAPWDFRVAIFSPAGNLVSQVEAYKVLSEEELREEVDKYIEEIDRWFGTRGVGKS